MRAKHLPGASDVRRRLYRGTFALGLIQALADRSLLTQFDYLSTVCIGWRLHRFVAVGLAAWLYRTQTVPQPGSIGLDRVD
jgi:hypothetical protein